MSFGKAFKTRKEANAYLKKVKEKKGGYCSSDLTVRKMSKKLFPRRTRLFHVGYYIEFLNFA